LKGHGSQLRVTSILTLLLALLTACGESTSPAPDLPYTFALTGYDGPMRLIRSNGTTEADLQCDPSCKYEVASWSRDGTKLALEGTTLSASVLYIANADGSSPVLIATSPSYCSFSKNTCTQTHYRKFDANWSADGRILYTLDDTSLVVVASDGSRKRILFSTADGVGQPRWGAADQTITFVNSATGHLFSLESAGGSAVRAVGNFFVGGYAWAPDGSTIAVQVYVAGTIADNSLYLVDPATGQSAQIVQASADGFAWSPLGNEIAIEKSDSLFVVDRRGTATFVFKGDLANPEWSPDGHYFIGTKNDPFDGSVFEISRANGSRRVVVSGGPIVHSSVKQSTRWDGFFDLFF
jgi:Tol biopolymer transport system component